MATLKWIAIEPRYTTTGIGNNGQFSAIGHYDDGTAKDLTTTVTWASSNSGVAAISGKGLANGVAVGAANITATSGSVVDTVKITVVPAHHKHIPFPVIMNTWRGHLKFWHSFVYNTPQVTGGPDPYKGHLTYQNGDTVVIQPKSQGETLMTLEVRADIPAPGAQGGQDGRMVRDTAYPLRPVVESPTSSDSTANIWRRGKTFAGKIKF